MDAKVYMVPNPSTLNRVLDFDPEVCRGCNLCVDVCPTDVMMPNPEEKKPPIVLYAEECWYCGGCVEECPHPDAVTLVFPASVQISVNWLRKDTGQLFRLGMNNPPPPNNRPPSGRVGTSAGPDE